MNLRWWIPLRSSVAHVVAAASLLSVTGCVGSETVPCPWGVTCPPGMACDVAHEQCVFPDQLEVCIRADDGSPCTFPSASGSSFACDQEVCVEADSCGDAIRDAGEECDGQDLGGWTCWTAASKRYGTLACAEDCTLDTSGCHECGNYLIDGPEDCDGSVPTGATCVSEGFTGGELACGSDCRWDTSHCYLCGNGRMEAGEVCDGTDLGGQTCESRGMGPGPLLCQDCAFDTSRCGTCGDGTVQSWEECDDGGAVAGDGCGHTCLIERCGNGHQDPGESCDDEDLGGQDCTSVGFISGTLACTGACTFDTGACSTGNVTFTGTVWSPGADQVDTLESNRFPIPGVRVTANPTAPSPLPSQRYCHQCTEPALGIPHTISDAVDGSFALLLAEGQTYYLTVQIGNFRRVRQLTVPTGVSTFTLEVAFGQPRPSETTLPSRQDASAGDVIPRIAIAGGTYEDVQEMFEALGFLYDAQIDEFAPNVLDTFLSDSANLDPYQVIIVPCGLDWPGGSPAVLRDWVRDGGTLWVDDMNYDFVEQPWPGFLSYYVADSSSGPENVVCGDGPSPPTPDACANWTSYDFVGSLPDPDLAAWASLPEVNGANALFFEEAWNYIYGLSSGVVGEDPVCGIGLNDEVFATPDVRVALADPSPFGGAGAPATVSFPYYCGRVLYTVFHTHSGFQSPYTLLFQEKLMLRLLLELQSCRDPDGLCP